jgi:nucleotide-binding universal stress UspA family protein
MEMTVVSAALKNDRLDRSDPSAAYRRVVVGVDDSEESLEAVRQAATLTDAGSTIELVAADIQDATSVLARAEAELAHSSARVVTRSTDVRPAWKALLAEAADADLLVVGKHGSSRLAGYISGSTATHVIHHAGVPVLVAVGPALGRFPERILVAAGPEPGHPELPVAAAARIARHAGGELILLRVDWARSAKARAVAGVISDYERATGACVEDVIVGGSAHHEIVAQAECEGASLIVVGSRELSGPAIRSVSERVAHAAHCSVLIVHA